MLRAGNFKKSFIKDLNDANRVNDPNLNAYDLESKGDLVISSELVEFPKKNNPTREYQKKDLDDVLADFSDMYPGVVDLDTDPSSVGFLQQSIKNLVKKDVELGEANINVGSGAPPQYNTYKYRARK